MVSRVLYGRGGFDDLADILAPQRSAQGAPFIFLVDAVFKGQPLADRIPLAQEDEIIFVDTSVEPKTEQVDALCERIRAGHALLPSGIIGIGGGSAMDLAKAVALLLTNAGSAVDYQGWDLIRQRGVYHLGIPTLSGTGAEVSRTAVLTGPTKKLGLNSDFTPFDQVLLDPQLTAHAPEDQRFYTGMDCYIHCVESLEGTYLNAFSQSYGEKALDLCLEVFAQRDAWSPDSDEKLMMASWHGGMSIAYSQVGVAHAMSYGLSYLLGTKHGVGNCIVFDQIAEFYPEGVQRFKEMVRRHGVQIPQGITAGCSDGDFNTMIDVALGLTPLWENALGKDWRQIATREKLRGLYERM